MLCEKYKDTLIETAANGGGALPNSLREHVETCAQCGATLAAQQALFTAVDFNMRRWANAEPPDSFLPGVRSRLTEERISRRSWSLAWAAIAASAALILGTVIATRDRHSGAVQEVKQTSLDSGAFPHPKEETVRRESPKASLTRIPSRWQESQLVQYDVAMDESRPILPTRNQQAIDQLIDAVARGEIKGEVLLTDARITDAEDLQIPRIAIATIAERAPRDATGNSSDTPGVKAREMSIDGDRRTK